MVNRSRYSVELFEPLMLAPGLSDEEIERKNPIGATYFVDGSGNEECADCGVFGPCLPWCSMADGGYAPMPIGHQKWDIVAYAEARPSCARVQ